MSDKADYQRALAIIEHVIGGTEDWCHAMRMVCDELAEPTRDWDRPFDWKPWEAHGDCDHGGRQ